MILYQIAQSANKQEANRYWQSLKYYIPLIDTSECLIFAFKTALWSLNFVRNTFVYPREESRVVRILYHYILALHAKNCNLLVKRYLQAFHSQSFIIFSYIYIAKNMHKIYLYKHIQEIKVNLQKYGGNRLLKWLSWLKDYLFTIQPHVSGSIKQLWTFYKEGSTRP